MSQPIKLKEGILPLRKAMVDFEETTVKQALKNSSDPDAWFRLSHPFGDFQGATAYYENTYRPLLQALPDLERRDIIVIAGTTSEGNDWVGCAGYYTGVFTAPFLDIPSTGHQVSLRYHEFYRIEEGRIVEMQALWDLPELMMQTGVWPLAPSLGREWLVPAPSTQDGIRLPPQSKSSDLEIGKKSCERVVSMLTAMQRYPAEGGPEVMELEKYWHPRMNWYGPSGIGTTRGIEGFRQWHQIPFLKAMPDRGKYHDEITYHFFGDEQYVGVTGWPTMIQTLTGDGWLGIPPTNKRVELRSLDFWRLEGDLIRENWVMVDLLHLYDQIGVDVMERMREYSGKLIKKDRK